MSSKKPTLDILLKKFPAGEFALMAEVRDAAGFGASRSADFIAMSLWPSRGLDMIGIERKSYRNDWLKELKTPAKAENIYQYCDRWYLLTDNENVAKIEEIPVTWGWMHIDVNGRLKTIKEAPKITPVPIGRSFLACVLKRAACKDGWVTAESIEERISAAKVAGEQSKNYQQDRIAKEFAELRKAVDEFEKASGITLSHRWNSDGKKTGEAVRFILDGGLEGIKKQITMIENLNIGINKKIEQYKTVSKITQTELTFNQQ